MGIIAALTVLFIAKKLLCLVYSIITTIIKTIFSPSRGRPIQNRRNGSNRIKSDRTANTELEQIKSERERIKLELDRQRLKAAQENFNYTRWKRKQDIKTGSSGSEHKKKLAQTDLDYCDQALGDLTIIIDKTREEYENTVNDKTRDKAYKRLVTLEARQNILDKKRQTAIYNLEKARRGR